MARGRKRTSTGGGERAGQGVGHPLHRQHNHVVIVSAASRLIGSACPPACLGAPIPHFQLAHNDGGGGGGGGRKLYMGLLITVEP